MHKNKEDNEDCSGEETEIEKISKNITCYAQFIMLESDEKRKEEK